MNMRERRGGDKGIEEWKGRRNYFRVKRGQEREGYENRQDKQKG
jgi:hypothetical protein